MKNLKTITQREIMELAIFRLRDQISRECRFLEQFPDNEMPKFKIEVYKAQMAELTAIMAELENTNNK